MTRGWAAIVVALAVAGCGGAPRPVVLDGAWPAAPGAYAAVVRDWTRHGQLDRDYQQVISVEATFKSPAWRAAYVARDAKARGLDAGATQQLLAEHRAVAAKSYEIELVVTTWDRRENELARPDPVWRVTLIDDQGRSLLPARIVRDKRPKHILRGEFPTIGDFAEAYVAAFDIPADRPVLAPGVKHVRLRLASERGSVELSWAAP